MVLPFCAVFASCQLCAAGIASDRKVIIHGSMHGGGHGQPLEASIAVDLQHATEVVEMVAGRSALRSGL